MVSGNHFAHDGHNEPSSNAPDFHLFQGHLFVVQAWRSGWSKDKNMVFEAVGGGFWAAVTRGGGFTHVTRNRLADCMLDKNEYNNTAQEVEMNSIEIPEDHEQIPRQLILLAPFYKMWKSMPRW